MGKVYTTVMTKVFNISVQLPLNFWALRFEPQSRQAQSCRSKAEASLECGALILTLWHGILSRSYPKTPNSYK